MKLFGNVTFQTPVRATDAPLFSWKERLTTDAVLGGLALACIGGGIALGAAGFGGAALVAYGAGAMAVAADLIDNYAFWTARMDASKAASGIRDARLAQLEIEREPRRAVPVPMAMPEHAMEISREDIAAMENAMAQDRPAGSFAERAAMESAELPTEQTR